MKTTATLTVDKYISSQPEKHQVTLQEIRKLIRACAPKAEELISYMIPAFKTSHMLVGFGVTQKYCSFYSMNPGLLKAMKEELSELKVSGSTIHFEPGAKLPVGILKKIVKIRIRENEERYGNRKK